MQTLVQPVYSSREVLNFTYECAMCLLQSNVMGSFVECGVACGSQIAMMQQACTDLNQPRQIYGYDSFEGIPWAGHEDKTQPGIGVVDKSKYGVLESSGVTSHDEENVLNNFKLWGLPTDNLTLVKGWFQNTVQRHVGTIALLRLDGDLYASTKVCLKWLLPLVMVGGIIIIDDWQLPGCRKAVLEHIPKDKIQLIHGIAWIKK